MGGKVHFRSLAQEGGERATCCGIVLETKQWDHESKKPYWAVHAGAGCALAADPADVTCKLCLRSKVLREHLEGWPDVEMVSASFDLLDAPDAKKRRLVFVSERMTKEEIQVLADLLHERVPNFLQPSISEVTKPYRHPHGASSRVPRERAELRRRILAESWKSYMCKKCGKSSSASESLELDRQ